VKRVIVRYRVKPERAGENVALIQAVFAELAGKAPSGIRYVTLRLDDGVSFVHIASIETADQSNPLAALIAFQEFSAQIKDRCVEPPVSVQFEVVGEYRLLAS
jgi:hypothetical protein